jgi:hypothetical protein
MTREGRHRHAAALSVLDLAGTWNQENEAQLT